MSWKGTLRSINAAARAVDRQAKQRQRELDRQQKQYGKMVELEQAAHEVEVFENYLERLLSLHKEARQPIQWSEMLNAQEPREPSQNRNNETRATKSLERYRPSFIDKLFRRTEKKRAMLSEEVAKAKVADKSDYRQAVKKYKQDHMDWRDGKEFARRVLSGDPRAFEEAIEEFDPFSELSDLGSGVQFEVEEGPTLCTVLQVHGKDIIPKQSKSLLKSGKLNVKQIPAGRFYELYQDYVCSSTLRVANELFALLPIENIVVTATDNLLNPSTGHHEDQAILSVAIPRNGFERLNLDKIDPSDSMQNFNHRMDFKKTKGFSPVERLSHLSTSDT